MDKDNLTSSLIKTLQSNLSPANLNSGRNEIMIRCPYCGDSEKSNLHAHLYIGLDNPYYFPYYCQRCTVSGIVDRNFFKDINVIDYSLIAEIEKFNKVGTNKKKSRKSIDSIYNPIKLLNRKKLILPDFKSTDRENAKLDYINSRYSFDLTPERYIEDYKVIFSFKSFIKENELEIVNLNDYMLKNLIKNYIGFLSNDQSYIIFRNIDPKCNKNERYFMFNIFNDPRGKRFYTCSSKVNILDKKIKLVLSEGPFDILGIREYFYKNNNENTIFASVNGKGYGLVINHFARMGFLDMDISIYSDSDVGLGLYYTLKRNLPIISTNNVEIIYNTKNKDYGIRLENINLKSNFLS